MAAGHKRLYTSKAGDWSRNTGLGPVRPGELPSAGRCGPRLLGSAGYNPAGRTGHRPVFLSPPSPKRVPAMRATAANSAFAASDDLRFKQYRVNVWKVLQFQPGNFLSNETLNRLQCGQFLAVHQGESIADVLGATSPSNAMDVILRMLRDIVIDNVTDAG